jgi:DNA-binding MarR family transcriptional regulator
MPGSREQLLVGLSKLGLVLRSEARSEAGLPPAQAQVIALLQGSSDELRVSDVSASMGVTPASASETVSALVEKGLVRKVSCPTDARVTRLQLTRAGVQAAERGQGGPDLLLSSVDELDEAEQGALLRGMTKIIASLQEQRRIPIARMCMTCQYFRPRVYEGARPHHCELVGAPFGDRELRIECAEHVPADADTVVGARRTMGASEASEERSSGPPASVHRSV